MAQSDPNAVIQIDVVSDVVCPWCIVGFKQLEKALKQQELTARLRWHPFELNPTMGPDGQNLQEHISEKYGSTPEQSQQARAQLTNLGKDLGFTFRFDDQSRIYNTFQAHQMLDWAERQGRQHPLKLAFFDTYFTEQQDISDIEVLKRAVASAGLDAEAAHRALMSGAHEAPVRQKQRFWHERGISGVPSMVFGGKYLVKGAQGTDQYVQVLQRCMSEAA